MKKPLINGSKITMSLEWFEEAVKAVDRESYSCGGMFTRVNADRSLSNLTLKLLQLDIDELKNVSK